MTVNIFQKCQIQLIDGEGKSIVFTSPEHGGIEWEVDVWVREPTNLKHSGEVDRVSKRTLTFLTSDIRKLSEALSDYYSIQDNYGE